MKIWQKEISLELLNQRGSNTLAEHIGIEFIEIGNNYLMATMPVDHRTKQPIGIIHGGASCVLAETVGSTAANICVDADYYCVGLAINTNHLKSVSSGKVIAKALPIHIGRSTQVWNIDIVDDQQRLISVTRLTLAVLAKP